MRPGDTWSLGGPLSGEGPPEAFGADERGVSRWEWRGVWEFLCCSKYSTEKVGLVPSWTPAAGGDSLETPRSSSVGRREGLRRRLDPWPTCWGCRSVSTAACSEIHLWGWSRPVFIYKVEQSHS